VSADVTGPIANLGGRVALVTGASRGIGRATAEALAAAGASVAVHYLANAARAEELAVRLSGDGKIARAYSADFVDPAAVRRLVEAVSTDYGRIDILVNNAGTVNVNNTEETAPTDWDASLAVNLTAPFTLVQSVLPIMKVQGKGAIVNVASIAGVNGGNLGPAYAATKGGLVNLTRYLARDCIKFGVRVNCVAPTMTDTDMVRQPGMETLRTRIVGMNPMGRLAHPEEIAGVIRFLASDEASFINGDCVMITGGP
jgi:NAD(P)-dependent dehydrogenase (short-subunit alcohol dehydrogenase family)